MKITVHFPLPSSKSQEAFRTIQIGEHEVAKDAWLLFNGGPKDYRGKLFALYTVGNFGRCFAILWSADESTVLDDAVDENLMDHLQIAEPEADDDCARLGNASEPFDLDNVTIREIPASVWQTDWELVYALGRCAGGENLKTGEDL